ncbi:hypothetical protein, partial [Sutterella wadsworthensis]|uniref:hypothetical protein n=1 Tax=Sutterella wadsworthensis TaxID=40545 RepID=UPI003FF0625C
GKSAPGPEKLGISYPGVPGKNLLFHFHGISSAKHPILDLNHSSLGSVIRGFRLFVCRQVG